MKIKHGAVSAKLKTCSKSAVNSYANACWKQAANEWFLTHHSHNNGKRCSQREIHVNVVSLINYFTIEISCQTYPQLLVDIFAQTLRACDILATDSRLHCSSLIHAARRILDECLSISFSMPRGQDLQGFSSCGSSGSLVPEITNQHREGDMHPFPLVVFISFDASECIITMNPNLHSNSSRRLQLVKASIHILYTYTAVG